MWQLNASLGKDFARLGKVFFYYANYFYEDKKWLTMSKDSKAKRDSDKMNMPDEQTQINAIRQSEAMEFTRELLEKIAENNERNH